MGGKRSTTPLFELLQQRSPPAEPPSRPETNGTPAGPEHADSTPAPEPRPQTASDSGVRIAGGVVQMPLTFAGVAVAVALAGVLGAWMLGFDRGEAAANAYWLDRRAPDQSDVIRELDQPPTPLAGLDGSDDAETPRTPAGPARFVYNGRAVADDPRLPGHNYLQLGSFLRPSEVESAASALSERGIDSLGVIDPASLGRNDGPLYVLFAGLGFPSGEAGSDQARRYRDQVVAVGLAWKASGGVKNFNDATWNLYRP